MRTITLTYGLPASGKSTWAMEQVNESDGAIVRVNMDDIRAMLGFGAKGPLPWSKELEQVALMVQDQAILSAVKAGRDVIVDNTHIQKNMPNRIKKLFDGDVLFEVKDFSDVSVHDCMWRDSQRENSVGSPVILKMSKSMQRSFKITEEWLNDVKLSPPYHAKANSLPAIVVDIDGTLARHDHRSPYDYSQLYTDGLHVHIANLVDLYGAAGHYVIIMSGRPDSYRAETAQWLVDNDIMYDALYMRAADDSRNDADVKQDLFDKHVRDTFRVVLWLDDRDRVVRRLRKLGINVAQVADGDF